MLTVLTTTRASWSKRILEVHKAQHFTNCHANPEEFRRTGAKALLYLLCGKRTDRVRDKETLVDSIMYTAPLAGAHNWEVGDIPKK